MKHCMLMSVLSLLFSLLLPVTVQHAAGISGGVLHLSLIHI